MIYLSLNYPYLSTKTVKFDPSILLIMLQETFEFVIHLSFLRWLQQELEIVVNVHSMYLQNYKQDMTRFF